MKRTLVPGAALAIGAVLGLAGCGMVDSDGGGDNSSLESMDPITLNVNGIGATGDQNMRSLKAFTEEIEERTKGKITFDLYEPNALLPTPEALKGTGAGVADIAVIVGVASPNELPITVWLSALAAQVADAYPAGSLQGGAAINELMLTNAELRAEYEAQNVHPLSANMYGQHFDLLCTKPVTDLASAKGVRVASPGPVWTELTERLGMQPTFFTSADKFEAVQRGAVDCEISPPEAHVTVGAMEIAKDYTPVPLTGNMGGYTLVINQDVWSDLPDEAQRIVEEAAATHWAMLTQGEIEAPVDFVDAAEKYSTVFHEPAADLLAAVRAAQEEAIEEMPKNAPAGVADPQAMIDEFDALVAKWGAEVPPSAYLNKDSAPTADTYRAAAELDLTEYYAKVAEVIAD